mgnify:CR=1 FL=1
MTRYSNNISKDSTCGGRKNLRTDTHNKENIYT